MLVPVLAILVGTGLVKVDVTPLCYAAGKLVPDFEMKGPSNETMLVPNKDKGEGGTPRYHLLVQFMCSDAEESQNNT